MIRNTLKALFFPLLGRVRPRPKAAKVPPKVSDQVLVFAGTFASEPEATDYALGLSDPSLSKHLGGAGIGPDDAEIIFGAERVAAALPMFVFKGARRDPGNANTFILLSDRGYDTEQMKQANVLFVGYCDIR